MNNKEGSMFEQITALHQQVRELVERKEPTFKVTGIDGFSNTQYRPTLASKDEISPETKQYIRTVTDIWFKVYATYVADERRKITVDVRVAPDGKLHMGDRLATY